MRKTVLTLLAIFAISLNFNSFSQEVDSVKMQIQMIESSLNYQTGVIDLPLANAKLTVPEGFRYLGPKDSWYVLSDLWGNPEDTTILGLLVPSNKGVLEKDSWVFSISFNKMGYVKDDDAQDIDYDELLEQLKEESKTFNEERIKLGYPSAELLGWASDPHYDMDKKVLHWAKEIRFGLDSINTLNYDLRVLGKDGVFIFQAVASMNEFDEVKPSIDKVLASVQFNQGYTYADFNPDIDNVAAWSIGGLVAGKVLAKAGFFGIILKFGKLIFIGIAAAGAVIWRFIRGRRKEESENMPDTVS